MSSRELIFLLETSEMTSYTANSFITHFVKYQYSLLAFLAKNELNIKMFYKNYIFGNKNLFNGTFLPYF